MFKQVFHIAWRNMMRNKLVSLINISGLAAGITACLLILIYIHTEVSYDNHWKDQQRIFRLSERVSLQNQVDPFALTNYTLAPELQRQLPAIEQTARLFSVPEQPVWFNGKTMTVSRNYFADSTLFELFNFRFLKGSPKGALDQPKTVVISGKLAERIFGQEEPIGKLIKYSRNSYRVTGVFDANEFPSHLNETDAFLSMGSMNPVMKSNISNDYLQVSTYTYLKLKEGTQLSGFQSVLNSWTDRVINTWMKENQVSGRVDLELIPVRDIHFDTYHIYDDFKKGNKKYVVIFGFIAVFLLLIGCFNYMNLTTAQAVKRAREVAVKKVSGASRGQLVFQFLGESLLITVIAFLISMALVELLLPGFNRITENESAVFSSISDLNFWLIVYGMLVLTGFAGGAYPAFFLSGLKPVDVLRNATRTPANKLRNPGGWLGKVLVVIQFTISMGMIAATLLVILQMDFIQNYDLGFNKDEIAVVNFPGGDSTWVKHIDGIRNELLQQDGIKDFATADHIPGEATGKLLFIYTLNGKRQEQTINFSFVDYDYARVLGLKQLKGRWFSKDFPSDRAGSFVINEAAAKFLGFPDPVNQELENGLVKGKITGVVKNYYYGSLHSKVEPMVFMLPRFNYNTSVGRSILLKVDPRKSESIRASIEKQSKALFPNHPVNYYFLDDSYKKQYRREEIMLQVFSWFAGLTILISCMGLFALAAFATEKRTKEIGIRKVLGATVRQLIGLVLGEFMLLVIISFLLATPITVYLINQWLADFAEHIAIPYWVFAVTGICSFILASFTVVIHAFKAARINPVHSLRYE